MTMTGRNRSLGLMAFCFATFSWGAGLPQPRLNTVQPSGGPIGQAVEVTLEGSDLEGVNQLYFSRPGLKAEHLGDLRFKISIPNEATPGLVDIRGVGTWGISNPRTFSLGSLPETIETEPNNLAPQAQSIAIDSTINGVVNARADVDYYALELKEGEQVVIDARAKRIDSAADIVLTLFDPDGRAIELSNRYDGKDARIDFNTTQSGVYRIRVHDLVYNGGPSFFYRLTVSSKPILNFVFPPMVVAGEKAEVKAIGRNLIGGTQAESISIQGEPMEQSALSVAAPSADSLRATATDAFSEPRQVTLDTFAVASEGAEPVPVGIARYPVSIETEANDDEAHAQVIGVPTEVAGRCDKPGDRDWFRFSLKKDEVVEVEAISEQAGFQADLRLFIKRVVSVDGATGAMTTEDVGEFDDNPAGSIGGLSFITSTHDPITRLQAPADGDYLVELADRFGESRGDGRFVYRLRIGPPTPDFRLLATPVDPSNPSSFVIRQGGTLEVQVLVLRQGGFSGEIAVSTSGLPAGVSASPLVIGPGMVQAPLILKAAPDAADATADITITGNANLGGSDQSRAARSASIIWPAGGNAPRPSRLERSLPIVVRANAPYALSPKANQMTVAQGSLVELGFQLERRWPEFTDKLANVTAFYLPPQVDNAVTEIPAGQAGGDLSLYVKPDAQPGRYTVIARGTAAIPFTKTPADPKAEKKPLEITEASLPVEITVVARPAEVVPESTEPTVKPGQMINFKVKVVRMNGYAGPIRLQLTLPKGLAGVESPEITLPSDVSETILPVRVANDVPVGDKGGLTVRGVAKLDAGVLPVDTRVVLKVAP